MAVRPPEDAIRLSVTHGRCDARHTIILPAYFWYSLRIPAEDGQAELTWVAGYAPSRSPRVRWSASAAK